MTRESSDKYGPLDSAQDERDRLTAAFRREDALQIENDRLREALTLIIDARGMREAIWRYSTSRSRPLGTWRILRDKPMRAPTPTDVRAPGQPPSEQPTQLLEQ